MSATGTVSGIWNRHQAAAPCQRRSEAHRRTTFASCCPTSPFGSSSDPMGRLEPSPDPTRVDHVAPYTNRHAHHRSGRFSCHPHRTRPGHATTTGALADVVGRATGMQCLLLARACGGASPVRHSHRLCDLAGLDESVKADDRKLGAQVTEWPRRALCTLRRGRSAAFTTCLVAFSLCWQRLWLRLFSRRRR